MPRAASSGYPTSPAATPPAYPSKPHAKGSGTGSPLSWGFAGGPSRPDTAFATTAQLAAQMQGDRPGTGASGHTTKFQRIRGISEQDLSAWGRPSTTTTGWRPSGTSSAGSQPAGGAAWSGSHALTSAPSAPPASTRKAVSSASSPSKQQQQQQGGWGADANPMAATLSYQPGHREQHTEHAGALLGSRSGSAGAAWPPPVPTRSPGASPRSSSVATVAGAGAGVGGGAGGEARPPLITLWQPPSQQPPGSTLQDLLDATRKTYAAGMGEWDLQPLQVRMLFMNINKCDHTKKITVWLLCKKPKILDCSS